MINNISKIEQTFQSRLRKLLVKPLYVVRQVFKSTKNQKALVKFDSKCENHFPIFIADSSLEKTPPIDRIKDI